ncbi:MAG: O-antigen ligase family protein [Anaerolineae bacterium]
MMRLSITRKQLTLILLLTLSLASILGTGLINRQIDFETRGVFDIGDSLVTHSMHVGPEIGLVVALEQYDLAELKSNFQQIDELGVKKMRQTYYYDSAFDWSVADQHFEIVQAFPELEIVPLLDGNPADNFNPISPNEFAAWAAEFANRYGERIEAYIIWDEPNITTHWGNGEINPQSYAALLSATSVSIRSIDPTAEIILAPLAPTTENNLFNMAEDAYLQELYAAGAADSFDAVAVKPYGFEHSPLDRTVKQDLLNFNRPILVREVMVKNGDGHKPVWAGNWGWNGLEQNWRGEISPWKSVLPTEQTDYTQNAFGRVQMEWPWMGTMFLRHWDPPMTDIEKTSDPAIGFSVSNQPDLNWLQNIVGSQDSEFAQPGYHPASPDLHAAEWLGDWRFSPEFGADMSEKGDDEQPDQVILNFEGTDIGLRVRRANYRARFNILIDGEPANALPQDDRTAEFGSALVLNTNSPDEDQVETITVATGLAPGRHTMVVTGFRGWDQWALKGFVVANQPETSGLESARSILLALAITFGAAALLIAPSAMLGQFLTQLIPSSLSTQGYLWLTSLAAGIVSISGWLTWGATAEGIFRRLGDGSQIAMLFGTAFIFYITPWLPVYLVALCFLFLLIYQRPVLGMVLITFSIPFYVPQLQKPIYQYRFSPVEIFTLVTFGAVLLCFSWLWIKGLANDSPTQSQIEASRENVADRFQLSAVDAGVLLLFIVACISLIFTERVGVATNELRTVIIGPTLFYWLLRKIELTKTELNWLLVAFISSGLLVALIGLVQYFSGSNLITAEGGLQRLRSIYGSPNNVALYLGRIFPLLLAFLLSIALQNKFSLKAIKSAWHIILAILIILAAVLLSFSRGGILLGLPISAATVLILFQKKRKRPVWPWIITGAVAITIVFFAALQVPALAGRLTLSGQTAGFRLNLWLSSWQIIQEQPLTGVGLDNFLYAYRNRYILARAWQEPNLNHPHNLILDFITRLGVFGLLAAVLIFWGTLKNIFSNLRQQLTLSDWAMWAGLAGSIAYILAHGLVDHSFFLVDLAYSTYFIVAISGLPLIKTDLSSASD